MACASQTVLSYKRLVKYDYPILFDIYPYQGYEFFIYFILLIAKHNFFLGQEAEQSESVVEAKETPVKIEKSPTKKAPKRKRILSSDSENEENEELTMKTEYEREDPDYEPGSEKYKNSKKVSRSLPLVAVDKDKDSNTHTSQSMETASQNSTNRGKDLEDNLRKMAKIDVKSSPRKDEKKKSTTTVENGGSDIHKHKSFHQKEGKSKDRDDKHKHRDKHRSSPHKKHGSVLLSHTNIKKDSELTFKLSNTPKKDSSHTSSVSSTKDNCPLAVNDSSTEAIKKMISGEKPLQHDKKSQQVNATLHSSKEKKVSHERKNANKLFPRPPFSDSNDTRKKEFPPYSGLFSRNHNNEQTKKTEREKIWQHQKTQDPGTIENHNLLGCIMTEMKKNN